MLYGTIGYTIFENNITRKKVIIFADKHDDLESCPNNIDMAVWFKTKFPTSKILLEEVPRNNVELEELWPTAKHTQSLKNLSKVSPLSFWGGWTAAKSNIDITSTSNNNNNNNDHTLQILEPFPPQKTSS